jgi:hypothetical protein
VGEMDDETEPSDATATFRRGPYSLLLRTRCCQLAVVEAVGESGSSLPGLVRQAPTAAGKSGGFDGISPKVNGFDKQRLSLVQI